MVNIIYVRPVYVDEESIEGSETLSIDQNGGEGSEAKVDFLSIARMNCFAARSTSVKEENDQKKNVDEDSEALLGSSQSLLSRWRNPRKNLIGQQLAAGWPAWLCYNASEAIKGWTPLRAERFKDFEKVYVYHGDEERDYQNMLGNFDNHYKASSTDTSTFISKLIDTETEKVVVLKHVKIICSDPESFVRSMAKEILMLRRLDHPNVIKLEGFMISQQPFNFTLVFEHMDFDWADPTLMEWTVFSERQVKCYMHQLLSGLEHCHSRGVFHRNINRSSVLSSAGILKITGFGSLSHFIDGDTSRYKAPELLSHGPTENDGVGVDLWSAGCILADLLAKKSIRPIRPGRTEEEQLDNIFKLCGSPPEEYWRNSKPHFNRVNPQYPHTRCIAETFKDSPPSSWPLIETLLTIDPAKRLTATAALSSQFFTSKPYACIPSSLPQRRMWSGWPDGR